jgi:hypothetical protein
LPRPIPNAQSLQLRALSSNLNPAPSESTLRTRDKIGLGTNKNIFSIYILENFIGFKIHCHYFLGKTCCWFGSSVAEQTILMLL